MVNVDIDKDLYESIKELIKKRKYEYPSVKFFVQRAIYDRILNSNNKDYIYDSLKQIIKGSPELKDKIDVAFNSKLKKLKDDGAV